MPLHFDCNATTAASEASIEAMLPWLGRPGANPSATHESGREAARAMRIGREQVAALVGARSPSTIVFTSCGSESTSLAFHSAALARPGLPTMISTVEHSATRKCAERSGEVVEIPVGPEGALDQGAALAAIARGPALVSLILLNNETGVISDLAPIGAACRERGVLFHVDAVQAPGKMTLDVEELGCDYLGLSAHKFHGPRGVGALYVRDGAPVSPLMVGGPQEAERRAGTENVPGIVGMGVAAERAGALAGSEEAQSEVRARRDLLERLILDQCPGTVVHGDPTRRAANTTNLGFNLTGTGMDAAALLGLLSAQGIEVSTGSACNATQAAPSPVLLAMGVNAPLAASSLRFSLAHQGTPDRSTIEDIERGATAVNEAYSAIAALADH
ncbi:MAG: cysteine desulfurase family protein [Planctomycetota bacterium]|nr:cysteine desulfurase family protein [Planctomycetota bacterium]MDG1984620.1 cysteine desulfurase family protein [Planctomycetota bacterium]